MRWVETLGEGGELKARLCIRGFKEPWKERENTYAPTPLPAILKIVLIRAHRRRQCVQLADVSRAFLHASMKDDLVYVKLPSEWKEYVLACGLEVIEDEVWLLKKAMYGLRSSPARWDDHFAEVMLALAGHKFKRVKSEPSVWIDSRADVVVVKYVDDLVVTGPHGAVAKFFEEIEKHLQL